MLEIISPIKTYAKSRILVPDARLCIASSLLAPHQDGQHVKKMLEQCVSERVTSIIWLGNMVEDAEGSSIMKTIIEYTSKIVECQYWVMGERERSLGMSSQYIAQSWGLHDFIDDGELRIISRGSLEAFEGEWLIACNPSFLSSSEQLVISSRRHIITNGKNWGLRRIGKRFHLETGVLCREAFLDPFPVSAGYWFLIDGEPYLPR